MTSTVDVLARGEELRQQGVDDGGGLWAMAEYVDWLVKHGEALMRVAKESAQRQARITELTTQNTELLARLSELERIWTNMWVGKDRTLQQRISDGAEESRSGVSRGPGHRAGGSPSASL